MYVIKIKNKIKCLLRYMVCKKPDENQVNKKNI